MPTQQRAQHAQQRRLQARSTRLFAPPCLFCHQNLTHASTPCTRQDINFSVVVTEGRPDGTGQTMARALDALGLPVTLVLDSGVAYALER